jgi:hypothetical protein
MRFSAVLGYQLIGNLLPGVPFDVLSLRSPTLGFAPALGKFWPAEGFGFAQPLPFTESTISEQTQSE